MTLQRAVAAIAAVITALLLQSVLVAPLTVGFSGAVISLPAVLVAAVAMTSGVGAGMSLGFTAGLLADLGSAHPVGLLALGWMLLGIGCGVIAEMVRGRRGQVLATALNAAIASTMIAIALVLITGQNVSVLSILSAGWITLSGDLVLAALVLPVLCRLLSTETLRRIGAPVTIRSDSAPSTPTVWSR